MGGSPAGTGRRVDLVGEVEKLYSEIVEEYNRLAASIYTMSSMEDVDRVAGEASRLKSRIQALESKLPLLKDAVCRVYGEVESIRSDAKRLSSRLAELYAKLSSINTVCGGSSFARSPERCIGEAEKLLEEAERLYNDAKRLLDRYYAVDLDLLSRGTQLYNVIREWLPKAKLGVEEVYKILVGSRLEVRVDYSNGTISVSRRLVSPAKPSTDIGVAASERLAEVLWSYVLSTSRGLNNLLRSGLPGIDTSSIGAYIESVINAKKFLDEIRDIATGASVEWRGRTVATITPGPSFTQLYHRLLRDVEERLAEMRIDSSSRRVTLEYRGSYDIVNNNWVLEPRYKLNCRWCGVEDVASSVAEAVGREVERLADRINSLAARLDETISEYNNILAEIGSVAGGAVTIDAVAAAVAAGALKPSDVAKLRVAINELKRELGMAGGRLVVIASAAVEGGSAALRSVSPVGLGRLRAANPGVRAAKRVILA